MKLVSVIGHPLLMASYISIVLLFFAPELFTIQSRAVPYLLLAVFLTTCIIPAFSIFSLKLFSKVSSLELTNREERPLPFMMIFIWYCVSSYLFVVKLELGSPFSTVIISVTLLIGLLFLITNWFKISIHATAIWSAVGVLSALAITRGIIISNVLIGFIMFAGLTNTSRLYLGYHQPKEIWAGTVLGFYFSFLAILFFG